MAQALLILLIGQLDHFGFAPVNSPQTAGVACSLTVFAYDAGNNIVDTSLSASLFASPGPQYGNIQIFVSHGVWQGLFTAYLADTYAIRCQDYGSHNGQSNQIIFNPNAAYRLLSILPGQTYYPGIDTGKSGSVISQQAGTDFPVSVYLTDRWCNRIAGVVDSLYATTSDNFKAAQGFRLSDGGAMINYSFRIAANHRFYLRDVSAPTIRADTSSRIYIYPGAYARLLVLLPGETHLPGDIMSIIDSTPGKNGMPNIQFVLDTFPAKVYATDTMWNKTTATTALIKLHSDFLFSDPPMQSLIGDSAVFDIFYNYTGDNQTLWAKDTSSGVTSYTNRLKITAKADSMVIEITPDTIMAGGTAQIRVTLFDRNGDIIPERWVEFSVLSGHGQINPDSSFTSPQGTTFSQFTCNAGFFDELDTIGVTADSATFKAVCFIEFPDSMVMEGKIIAFPNPIGIRGDHTRMIYYLNQNCDITYAIYDPFGNLVHRENFTSGQPHAHMGVNFLDWYGINDKGHRVASGIYYIMLKGYINTNVFLEKRIKVGVIW